MRRGDANNDGTLNIFDALAVLKLNGKLDVIAARADYDHNSRIDIFDLLGIMEELSGFKEQPEPELQFITVINWHLLTEPVVVPMERWDDQGEVRADYAIHADRPITDAELIFGTDTVQGLEGRTPLFYKVDLESIPDYSSSFIFSDTIPWKSRVLDQHGTWHEHRGRSTFKITDPDERIDYDFRLIGERIAFPLVLRGAWQRFKIVAQDMGQPDTILVDLNSACQDSVIFPNIDSLAAAIMENILEDEAHRPEKQDYFLLVSPSVDFHTKLQNDSKLILTTGSLGWWIAILPVDRNNNLLKKLGFPGWIRRISPPIRDLNYEIKSSFFTEYSLRRIGRQ